MAATFCNVANAFKIFIDAGTYEMFEWAYKIRFYSVRSKLFVVIFSVKQENSICLMPIISDLKMTIKPVGVRVPRSLVRKQMLTHWRPRPIKIRLAATNKKAHYLSLPA